MLWREGGRQAETKKERDKERERRVLQAHDHNPFGQQVKQVQASVQPKTPLLWWKLCKNTPGNLDRASKFRQYCTQKQVRLDWRLCRTGAKARSNTPLTRAEPVRTGPVGVLKPRHPPTIPRHRLPYSIFSPTLLLVFELLLLLLLVMVVVVEVEVVALVLTYRRSL